MRVKTHTFSLETQGFSDVIDITRRVEEALAESGLGDGLLAVYVPGSTAGVTTIEYESGAVADLKAAIERMAPQDIPYAHDARWGDMNGFAHVRAALLGPSLGIPFKGGRLLSGTWQQVVLIDFDNRPRRRQVIVQMVGA